MPEWVIDYILEPAADIVILTECCDRVPNWAEQRDRLAGEGYLIFTSQNEQVENNDVTIAVKKEKIRVESIHSFLAEEYAAPDNLRLDCRWKDNNQEFSVVGMRIHSSAGDTEKRNELEKLLNSLINRKIAIIAGDFNNYRRSCKNTKWSMDAIDGMCCLKSFTRITPEGASWARNVNSEDPYCFALDHFLVKGIADDNIKLNDYDRKFNKQNKKIYQWGEHFQSKYSWENEDNKVPSPFPDHAILSADITL